MGNYKDYKVIKKFRQVFMVYSPNTKRYYIIDVDKNDRIIKGTREEGYASTAVADFDFEEVLKRYSGFSSEI